MYYCIWCSALVVLAVVVCSWVVSCLHCVKVTVRLMMGIIMPETCRDRSFIINIGLVASCWFISLHPVYM